MMRDIMCYYSSGKLVVAVCLMISLCRTCKASDGTQNCSSLCGDHNISSPFRVKESPEKCGDKKYELSCEKNQLFLYLESMRYRVLSINYVYDTIRVREAGIEELDSSSLPQYSLTGYNFSRRDPYTSTPYSNNITIYVRCEHPMDSPGFVDTAPCFNTSNGSLSSSSSSSSNLYVYVGSGYLSDMGLEDGCLIEMIYLTSWPDPKNQSLSCTHIHTILLYGFELSWYPIYENYSIWKQILWAIKNYLTYIQALIILAMYSGAKFVLGAPFVIALLTYKWRRRHLSMY